LFGIAAKSVWIAGSGLFLKDVEGDVDESGEQLWQVQTLQATALVHEAYLRLVNTDSVKGWDSRGHFSAAAAAAMRRIVVEQARAKQRLKRGGQRERVPLDEVELACGVPSDQLLALDEAIARLETTDPDMARIVQLRFFVGMNHDEVAAALGISSVTARRHWRYARAWLRREIREGPAGHPRVTTAHQSAGRNHIT
jgi:RNA polymerase sigma factor (TIGR02999 family)